MSSVTVYRHPDGPTLSYSASELVATDDNGNTVHLPIGPDGLQELAAELVTLANDSGNLAEQAGAGAAVECLNALLRAKHCSAGERIEIVQNAITSLQRTTHPDRAAGGFAVVLTNVVQRGLEALQPAKTCPFCLLLLALATANSMVLFNGKCSCRQNFRSHSRQVRNSLRTNCNQCQR